MSRRFVVGSLLLVSLAGAAANACSSKSSDPAAGAVVAPRVDAGTCTRECCELPAPGTSCAGTDAGVTCGYAATCQEGLVISRRTTCERGYWQSVNDCPAAGGVDERGCPAAPPVDKSPCAAPSSQGSFSCGYSRTCEAKLCDASSCVPIHQSATATCVQGVWQSTPLGPC